MKAVIQFIHRQQFAACVFIILCFVCVLLVNFKNSSNLSFNLHSNSATRYIPEDNAVILDHVIARPNRSTFNKFNNKKDLNSTLQLAEQYFNKLRLTGDSRYLSYLQSLLSPWLTSSSVDHNIILLQALIYQYQHEFNKSLKQFDYALQINPQDVRAYYYRAYVYLAMGKPKLAYADCVRSFQISTLLTISCTSLAESRMGLAQKAAEKLSLSLEQSLARTPTTFSDQELGEAFFTLAQIEFQIGQFKSADKHFLQAIHFQPNNISVLTAYSDLLIHTHEYGKAKALLEKAPAHSYLKVRLAITLQYLEKSQTLFKFWKPSAAKNLVSQLDEHFTLQKMVDDKPLGRDYILYLIKIKKRYSEALNAALKNWTIHHEPEDAYLVLQAALLSQTPEKSKPVVDWIQKSALDDVRLNHLISKLSH